MRVYIILMSLVALVLPAITKNVPSRLVFIKSGPVRGYKDLQDDVFVFYGIPYAKAPTGTQRFKSALPPTIWYKTFEAVDKGIVCPQLTVIEDAFESSQIKEDCLIANIYVSSTTQKNLPVIVYVHGGAFVAAYGTIINPIHFIRGKNMIAITFNYRVSAHGFLCLGTEDVPGNAGMKDQVTLLRWVKNNIQSFGGNPDDITISGYSAGASAVELLMLSKMAKGLFHKVIIESGSSLSPFSVQSDPIKTARGYAKLIGKNNVDDIYELEHFFKTAPYDILQSGNVLYQKNSSFTFAPCVERDLGQEIFLEDIPLNILRKGNFSKLPVLYGVTNMEGLMRVPVFKFWKKDMNKKFADFIPADLHFESKEVRLSLAKTIRQFYFGDKLIDNNSVLDYIDYFSHTMFTCPALRVVNHLLKAGHDQIYLYMYSYTDDDTPIIPHTKLRGANHCDQTIIILGPFQEERYSNPKVSNDYQNMRNIMRELWINFIKNGKPEASGVPPWPPVVKNGLPYMVLNRTPELGGPFFAEKCSFWDKIYDSYYDFPYPPLI